MIDDVQEEKQDFSDDAFANALKDLQKDEMLKQVQHDKDKVQDDGNNDDGGNVEEDKTANEIATDSPSPRNDDNEDEELLKDEEDLKKYDTFIKAGFTPDEALEKTYGDFKELAQTGKSENVQFQALPENQYGDLTAQDYEMLKQAYNNPTDANLLFHLKKDPELRADFARYNLNVDDLQTIDIYQDAAANNMFRMMLKESYRNKIGGIINEIDSYNAVIEQNNKARASLISEFENDFLKDFPELDKDDIKSYSLAKHFVDRFKQKTSVLSAEQQKDADLIRKLYQSAKEEYKKLYPALKKKLGFVEPEKIENAQIKNQKLKEMQDKGSTPTGLADKPSTFNLGQNSSDDDFANAFKELLVKK